MVGALAAELFVLSSCATLPDLKPFAAQTANLQVAVETSYARTRRLLVRAEVPAKDLQRLDAAWEPTDGALQAIADYSDALAGLAEAGAKGSASANALAESLSGLLKAVGPITGGAAAVPAALVDAFKLANTHVANVRARKSLREAVTAAQPAVYLVAEIVRHNLTALSSLSLSAGLALKTDIEARNSVVLNYHKTLLRSQEKGLVLLTTIREHEEAGSAMAKKELRAELLRLDHTLGPDFGPGELARLEQRAAERTAGLGEEIGRISSRFEDVHALLTDVEQGTSESAQRAVDAQRAVRQWAEAHRKIQMALDKKRAVSFLQLTSAVKQVVEQRSGGE